MRTVLFVRRCFRPAERDRLAIGKVDDFFIVHGILETGSAADVLQTCNKHIPIPAHKAEKAPADPEKTTVRKHMRDMMDFRIFIVEDESIVAQDLEECLIKLGYGIAGTARSGEVAIEKVRADPPDLVLMDIHLAGTLDGIQAAGEIAKTCDIPVIYLTAYADKALLERAKLTQPYGYVIKPYDERELQSVIEMARYRHEMDKKLLESEEKYRALAENTPDILFSTDMAGIITYVSPQVNKFGFLEEEVLGKTLSMLIHPADVDLMESTLSRALECGAQFISEFRILDKWGTVFWFEEKSFLRLDILGKPVGMYGILRDVTERKHAKDAIDIANKKLNLMNQITRHDILNTITGLLGCVDMAKATHSPEEKDQFLGEIRDLTRVIQSHITFTREYQEVGVHLPQWQNINAIICHVAQIFGKCSVTISSEFEQTEIYADPLLEKVIYNLVENAIRYGEKLTTISIYSRISDNDLLLIVEDDGIGIEEKQKREIFKRGVGKNTGMGLFLTAEILAITGINIEEKGTFGEGARFEIRVPNGTWRYSRE
jgi:PAS domain S-box-containing protein